jgi:hypothetical protein
VRQLFLRMFSHEVRLHFRVLSICCSTLLVRYTLCRVYLCGSRFRSSTDSLRCLQMKGAILFCDYLLLQRTWLLGLFLTPQKVPFGSLAPLLRFGSLQWLGYQEPVFPRFSLPGTVHSCAFSSLQWFALPYTSRVYFTPIHSWDFPSELSPLRDRFLLPKLFTALRRPMPFYRWLLCVPDTQLPCYPG